MTTADMLKKGMAKNTSGFWVAQQMPLGRGGTCKRQVFARTPGVWAPLEASRRKAPGVIARVAALPEAGT
jgi:hypothetical protein